MGRRVPSLLINQVRHGAAAWILKLQMHRHQGDSHLLPLPTAVNIRSSVRVTELLCCLCLSWIHTWRGSDELSGSLIQPSLNVETVDSALYFMEMNEEMQCYLQNCVSCWRLNLKINSTYITTVLLQVYCVVIYSSLTTNRLNLRFRWGINAEWIFSE